MGTKINKLRQRTPSNGILLTSWLVKSGFSRSEVSQYLKSEWLQRISTGVYQFTG
ncbi:AbiEi antitoxin N-terminal domain-containing protein, partial [Xylanibacter caecicola]|uniref:AbiEi antitoxin N-terminal domain-containing protein n=1 Tax=Xylanibacter caecicola TaxID=2736294 RepID=UPI003336A5B1